MMFSSLLPSSKSDGNLCYLKRLPTTIFLLIENYLNSDDYNQLINSSQSLFKEVKQHIFDISEFSLQRESNYEGKENQVEQLELLFEQFYSIRKQFEEDSRLNRLKLFISDVPENIFMKYAYSYAHIYHLRVRDLGIISTDFDFSVFNNIHTVRLEFFTEVKYISKGLQNIRNLTINNFDCLVSIDCPLVDLDYLSICACNELKSIRSLENIKKIHLLRCEQLIPDLSKTKDSLRCFSFSNIKTDSFQLDMIPYQSLDYLHISDYSLVPEDNLHLLVRIPHLEFTGDYLDTPEFPLFHGKHLFLGNCCLSAWKIGIRLENLRSLYLNDCSICKDLPIFPQLRRLELNLLNDLYEIHAESFPRCIRLNVYNCSNIRFIHRLPKVKTIEVNSCEHFQELIGYHDDVQPMTLKTVFFTGLNNFSKMSCLRDVTDITIVKYQGVRLDFHGFDQSNLPKERRKVFLDRCGFPTDLTGLGNIGTLEINRGYGLVDGQGMHDVDHLIVRDVSKLTSFIGCRGLNRVDLYQSRYLKSLDGLQNVPMVSLLFALDAESDSESDSTSSDVISPIGLQGCGQVYCHESLPVALEAQKYVTDRLSTPFAEIFDSVKEFYVLQFRKDDYFIQWEDCERIRLW